MILRTPPPQPKRRRAEPSSALNDGDPPHQTPISDRRLVVYNYNNNNNPLPLSSLDPSDDLVCTYHCKQMVKSEFVVALNTAEKDVADYRSRVEALSNELCKSEEGRKNFRDHLRSAEQELAASKRREHALQERLLKEVTESQERYQIQLKKCSELEVPMRDEDKHPAVCVYTVCNESKYLVVKNVPALGCEDELTKLFGSYGEIEECKPMDAEDCEPFTDVYWLKFSQVSNARFAKRKLDESVFLGNRLQVSYAPQFESLLDTKEKLEGRRKEVLRRINYGSADMSKSLPQAANHLPKSDTSFGNSSQRDYTMLGRTSNIRDTGINHVSSNREYFLSSSMNETVCLVREKLDKIKSSSDQLESGPASKKTRLDNRRRI